MSHKRPKSAMQEKCSLCGADAYHKVAEEYLGEEIPTPTVFMHPMTNYICCACFSKLMNTRCEPE